MDMFNYLGEKIVPVVSGIDVDQVLRLYRNEEAGQWWGDHTQEEQVDLNKYN